MCLLVIVALIASKSALIFYREYRMAQWDYLQLGVLLSMLMTVSGLFWYLMHLFVLDMTGNNIVICEILSTMALTSGHATMVTLLYLLATGWTISYLYRP